MIVEEKQSGKIVPVCFALDNGYVMPTSVALLSLLDKLPKGLQIHLYLLVPNGFNEYDAETLLNLCRDNDKIKKYELKRIDNSIFEDYCHIGHITSPTYFRLLMAELIPLDECLYLDGDIMVLKDISNLFDVDISKFYVAGVRRNEEKSKKIVHYQNEHARELGISDCEKYINAGVLLFNLKKIREDRLQTIFMNLLKKNFSVQDQDIINSACYPNIQLLSHRYNLIEEPHIFSKNFMQIPEVLCLDTNDVVICHYATMLKPWKYKGLPYEEEWLSYYNQLYSDKLDRKNARFAWFIKRCHDAVRKIKRIVLE